MNKKVNWGIIAVGGIAKRRTLPAMESVSNAKIVAIMDKNAETLDGIAKEYNIPYTYETEKELLNNPLVDAVYVASPVCFHKEQALQVLKSGKHLLLEKPLGMNMDDAKEIVTCAGNSGKKAGVAMVMKHHPAHIMMKEILSKGEIGSIISCRAQLNCWFPDMEGNWRQKKATAGGGALVDMGTHCIDLLRYLLGDDPRWVFADIDTKTFHYEVDDSADCILHMKKGTTCYIDVHFNVPDEAAKGMLEIYGTKGSILATGTIGQDGAGEVFLNLCDADQGYNSQQARNQNHLGQSLNYEKYNIYGRQIQKFSDAVLADAEISTPLENALETVRIVDALYQSAAEKKAIIL